MTDLPAPLTPPDCDLRGYDFMPLFGHRLFSSEFYIRASDAGFRAGIRLWWASWQQCPAASLPDDDLLLCRLADFGRDVKAWRALRDEALHGFVRCSDGRLYHRLLAEEALAAWDRRRKERDRKAKMRAARGAGQDADVPRDKSPASAGHHQGQAAGQDADVPSDRTGQDRTGQDLKEDPLTPTADAAGGQDRSSIGNKPLRGTRASGTNPRAVAAAERAAAPPPPEPDHPLWPACRGRDVTSTDFRRWIEPLVQADAEDGRTILIAPSPFHASHVRREFALALEAALGHPPEIRAHA
ncbi:MAG: DUF1376 domain-containing protein [Acetobacteraceae bacterium]|nr:DUF1376 domain-containing protein [Acetobacteraceae bacterium]